MKRISCVSNTDWQSDLEILNNALYLENRLIWTYSLVINKLSNTGIGQSILTLALENIEDHRRHRMLITDIIQDLLGRPIRAEASYDLSYYLNNAEGDFFGDVEIVKLLLALETDAAIAYTIESTTLSHASLRESGAEIGCVEAIHVARLREVINAFFEEVEIIPSSRISLENREKWVLNI